MTIDMNLVLEIVLGLIGIAGTVLTVFVIPYFKSKTTTEQREDIVFWVKIAVQAAEQVFNVPKMGAAKKQFVINFLKNQGISLTEEQLQVLIEASVKQLNLAADAFKETEEEKDQTETVNP